MNAYTGAHAPSTAAVRQFNLSPEERASISVMPLKELLLCAGQRPIADAAAQPALLAGTDDMDGPVGAASAAAAPVAGATEPVLAQAVVQSATTEQATAAGDVMVMEEEIVSVTVCSAASAAALQNHVQAIADSIPVEDSAVSAACEGGAAEAQQLAQTALLTPAEEAGAVPAVGGHMPDSVVGADLASSGTAAGPPQQNGTVQAAASDRQQHAESSGRSPPQPVQLVRTASHVCLVTALSKLLRFCPPLLVDCI